MASSKEESLMGWASPSLFLRTQRCAVFKHLPCIIAWHVLDLWSKSKKSFHRRDGEMEYQKLQIYKSHQTRSESKVDVYATLLCSVHTRRHFQSWASTTWALSESPPLLLLFKSLHQDFLTWKSPRKNQNLMEKTWLLESNKPETESWIHHYLVPYITKLQFPHLQDRHESYIHLRGKWRLHEREIMFILWGLA